MTFRLASTSILTSLLFAATFTGAGCTSSSSSDSTLTVENEQSVAINELFVDSVGDESFSDNLLGNEPLDPGDTIVLDVTCDHYDVEIDNEDGTSCVVPDLDLCFNDVDWIIDDSTCTFAGRIGDKTQNFTVPKTKTVPRTHKPTANAITSSALVRTAK